MIRILLIVLAQCLSESKVAVTYFVSIHGNDKLGDGSRMRPWRTLAHATVNLKPGKYTTLQLSPGVFIENEFIQIPPNVDVIGNGPGSTIIKPDSNLYSRTSEWQFDSFLLMLNEAEGSRSQKLTGFTIDGAGRNLYGGILICDRDEVILSNIEIRNTYYTGIWVVGSRGTRVTQVSFNNCAWGSDEGCSAAIQFTACEDLEIDHLEIRESIGYGLKGVGDGRMYGLKIHHNSVYVRPEGMWRTPGGDHAPNMACELYNVELKECEIYENYFNSVLSIAMDKPVWKVPPQFTTVNVYRNIFDLLSNGGTGYGIELTVHNAVVSYNYFLGGTTGIVNWDASAQGHTMHNWKIHHNIFYSLRSIYPSSVINLFRNGIVNLQVYNNTVEFNGNSTIDFISVNNGGIAENIESLNNLIINSASDFNWRPPKVVNGQNGGNYRKSVFENNSFYKIEIDSVHGVTFRNNLTCDPGIKRIGERPMQYYFLQPGSPLIDKGKNVDEPYVGHAPDIGALEFHDAATVSPIKIRSQ